MYGKRKGRHDGAMTASSLSDDVNDFPGLSHTTLRGFHKTLILRAPNND